MTTLTYNSRSISDERTVKNFDNVVAGGPIQVIIKMGSTESLRFEGDAEAISTLVAEVKGSTLVIRPKTSWISWAKKYENKKIIAYVNAKQLTALTMSGDGSITVSGTIKTNDFSLTLSGSGSIRANVAADEIEAVVSGSGKALIEGTAAEASVTLSGPGTFGTKALEVDELSARISGKGSINISCSKKIKAFISGSGHINYLGSPEIQKTVIGTGGVNKL
ncbi:head GIN domain-containing protein [Pedobacter africanus]|nr:head GIN domain-containing protein [Pedobacter africanus]